MLRAIGAYLLMFWLISTIVQLDGMARVFGAAGLALLAIDLLTALIAGGPRPIRIRRQSLL